MDENERIVPRQAAWTLLETLIAVALVGVLFAIVMPYLLGELRAGKEARAMGDLRAIEADLETFLAETAELPDDLAAVGWGGVRDPWGYEYRYFPFKGDGWKSQARKDRFLVPINSTYDLYSVGADGDTRRPLQPPPSHDDVIRANDGDYLGLARNY